MKKIAFLIGMMVLSTVATAGQIIWSASGLTSTFEGGMAYLVQKTDGAATISDIATHLNTIGTEYNGNDFKHWTTSTTSISDGTIVENSGYYYVASVTAGESITTETSLDNFFVVVINGSDYAISEFLSSDPIAGNAANWNPSWTGNWTTGKVAQSIPEPTALALLALGVAGVALRRRLR